MWCSHVNHAWHAIMGTISNINSSNLAKVKLVKVLKTLHYLHSSEHISNSHMWFHFFTHTLFQFIVIEHMRQVGNKNYSCKNILFLFIHVCKHLLYHLIITWGRGVITISHRTKIISCKIRPMGWSGSHDFWVKKPFHKWEMKEKKRKCEVLPLI
jgi:hypothetical protein